MSASSKFFLLAAPLAALGAGASASDSFSAGAINDAHAGNSMSVADVRDTSQLYVDVLSSGAEFIGSDGHRYASATGAAPVPEPSALALMMAGLAGIAARVRPGAGGVTTSGFASRSRKYLWANFLREEVPAGANRSATEAGSGTAARIPSNSQPGQLG